MSLRPRAFRGGCIRPRVAAVWRPFYMLVSHGSCRPPDPPGKLKCTHLAWTQGQIFDVSFLGALESMHRVNFS
jgi:hypothetical protein